MYNGRVKGGRRTRRSDRDAKRRVKKDRDGEKFVWRKELETSEQRKEKQTELNCWMGGWIGAVVVSVLRYAVARSGKKNTTWQYRSFNRSSDVTFAAQVPRPQAPKTTPLRCPDLRLQQLVEGPAQATSRKAQIIGLIRSPKFRAVSLLKREIHLSQCPPK